MSSTNLGRSRAGRSSSHDSVEPDVDLLASRLEELARSLQAEDETGSMLDRVTAAAVHVIPGVEAASISSVVGRRTVISEHATADLPRVVDAIQTELGEGPCLSAIYEEQTVRVPDLRHEQRWPEFARRAHDSGAGSMLSFQLFVDGDNLGSLNLYNYAAAGFDDESEQVGLLFASHAAVAYAGAKKIDELQVAVTSRDLIGQAKGILMERYSLDGDHAFQLLVRISQSTHRKLRDIAHELVTTRHLQGLDQDHNR